VRRADGRALPWQASALRRVCGPNVGEQASPPLCVAVAAPSGRRRTAAPGIERSASVRPLVVGEIGGTVVNFNFNGSSTEGRPAMAPLLPRVVAVAVLVVLGGVANVPAADIPALFQQLDADGDGFLSAAEIGSEHRLLHARLVRTGDAGGDGQLDLDDFQAALEPLRADKRLPSKAEARLPGVEALLVVISLLDRNRDGRLAPDEAVGPWEPAFQRLLDAGDDDKNGRLEPRELARQAPRLRLVARGAARELGIDVVAEWAALPPAEQQRLENLGAVPDPREALRDPVRAAELFTRLDADGDARLDVDELPAELAERLGPLLQRADRDGSGGVEREEFLAAARRLAGRGAEGPGAAGAEGLPWKRFDEDGDQRLSLQEVPPQLRRRFRSLDGDQSGFLEAPELRRLGNPARRNRPDSQAAEPQQANP